MVLDLAQDVGLAVVCLPLQPHILKVGYCFPCLGHPRVVVIIQNSLSGNVDKDVVANAETGTCRLFLYVLEHVDVLRDAWYIGLVDLYIAGKVESVNGMEATTVVQKMGEDLVGSDICVECLPVL